MKPYANVLLYGVVAWLRAWSRLADRLLTTEPPVTPEIPEWEPYPRG